MRAALPEPRSTKMTEMVRVPDTLGGSTLDGGDEVGGRARKEEAIVLRNGSLKFDLDVSSEGLESTLNKLVC